MLLILGLLFGTVGCLLALLESYDKLMPSKWIMIVQWVGLVTGLIGIVGFMISHGGFWH